MSKSGYPEKAPVVGRSVADSYKDISERMVRMPINMNDCDMISGEDLTRLIKMHSEPARVLLADISYMAIDRLMSDA